MMTAKDIMDKVATIQGTSDNDIVYQRNQATLSGGVIGMIIGLYVGHTRKKSLLVYGVFGALGGALIARIFVPKN